MNYKTLLLALGAMLLTAGTAKATDGTLSEGGTWTENTWKTAQIWVHDTVAKDGGVATITATKFQNSTLNQNVNGLTLSGINFGNMAGTFSSANSYDVTLVGANPFISSTAVTGANISLLLRGESGTLHKTGAGHLAIATPVSGFASVSIDAGPVAVGDAAWLYYDDVPGAALTNALSGAGKVALQNTSATLGGGAIGSLRLIDGSTAALAGDLSAGEALLDSGTTLQAASGAAPTLTMDVAAGETRAIAGGVMGDGAGKLALVKTGAGELAVGGAHSYTGGTILDAGTLRLVGGVTNGADIAFWLDASKTDTVTVADDGSVSAWRSCGGDGVSFGKHTWWSCGLPSAYDAEDRRINGLPTVTFSATGAKNGSGSAATYPTSRLVANKKTTQRTVFMVCRPRILSSQPGNTGAWGADGRDMGQRLGPYNWSDNTSGASYINEANAKPREIGAAGV